MSNLFPVRLSKASCGGAWRNPFAKAGVWVRWDLVKPEMGSVWVTISAAFGHRPIVRHRLATGMPHNIHNYGSETQRCYPVVGILVEFALLL